MKIAIFDSGVGGLTVAREIFKALPYYDYLYLGDNARAPYGTRSQEEIYEYTREGVRWLFEREAKLCILACATASSQALRKLQQERLLKESPDRKLLGIIIPIAEEVSRTSQGLVGIMGTPATVASQSYVRELRKLKRDMKIIQLAAPGLVPLIEKNAHEEEIKELLKAYISPMGDTSFLDTFILGSTHYALIEALFRECLGSSVNIPQTGAIVAKSLKNYLLRHSEIEKTLTRGGQKSFYTSGNPEMVTEASKRFLGEMIKPKRVKL